MGSQAQSSAPCSFTPPPPSLFMWSLQFNTPPVYVLVAPAVPTLTCLCPCGHLQFETPELQEEYVKEWARHRTGLDCNFKIKFYPGRYAAEKGACI